AVRYDHRSRRKLGGGRSLPVRRPRHAGIRTGSSDVRERLAGVYAGWKLERGPGRVHTGNRRAADRGAGKAAGRYGGEVLWNPDISRRDHRTLSSVEGNSSSI